MVRGLLEAEGHKRGGRTTASMFEEVFCFPKGQIPLVLPLGFRFFSSGSCCSSSGQEGLALFKLLSLTTTIPALLLAVDPSI